ncbi:MAG: 4Fe-4S binding protein [Clostridiales bacterium]|nr:4Fe-4S binding protein [Clostridiales bacterium]
MLKTNIMGIPVDNPVVIASGPWTRGVKKLRKALDSGAGAVITETIVGEIFPDACPQYTYNKTSRGLQNIRLYTGHEFENWIQDLYEINKCKEEKSNCKLIASIMGSTASELCYIAKKVEKTGIDGIEIGLACPMGEGVEIIASNHEKVYEYTKCVVDTVNVPVAVKLSGTIGNLPLVVNAAERAGAAGITGIDTIRCVLNVDIEERRPTLPTYGGYSGSPIRPIALATVAGIVQSTGLPVIGMGGIENYSNLIEFIMLGASAGGIGTGILLNGYPVVKDILDGLKQWMQEHEIGSIEEIRGQALDELRAYKEIKIKNKKAHMIQACGDVNCGMCANCCIEDAIVIEDGLFKLHDDMCTGCGICVDVCPKEKIKLTWR